MSSSSSSNDAPGTRPSQAAAAAEARDLSATEPKPASPPSETELATPSALPALWRRSLAFAAILIGGVCGALIGYGFGDISCASGSCTTATGSFTLLGAIVGAGGVAIVAILALRAMDEWESIGSQRNRATNRRTPRPRIKTTK